MSRSSPCVCIITLVASALSHSFFFFFSVVAGWHPSSLQIQVHSLATGVAICSALLAKGSSRVAFALWSHISKCGNNGGAGGLATSAQLDLTPFQHVSLAPEHTCIIILHPHHACHPRSLSAPPAPALPPPRPRPPPPPLSTAPTTILPSPSSPVPHQTPRSTLRRSRTSAPLRSHTLLDVSSHRIQSHPPHVAHPTRGAPPPVSLLARPGAVVFHSASTAPWMPLGDPPYSTSSLGSLPLRCRVPTTATSQTFLSCPSTWIPSHSQTLSPLLDRCVAEKHLCARIPWGTRLHLASHTLGNIPRFTAPPIPSQIPQEHRPPVFHSIRAVSHSTISCPSFHAASIPALRSDPSGASATLSPCLLSILVISILSAYNQMLTSI